MDSSFFSCAVAITLFTLLCTILFMFHRKLGFHQERQTTPSSSSSLALNSSPPSSLSKNRKYHVFPSFHGADVRKNFLAHILKEFRGKGIDIFIDNDIQRSMSIGPELKEAIRGSRIAIVLLSRNYASSSWCLNELVEIMKCRKEFDQIAMTIFYEVDPTDVKKQTGDFGKAFRKTCKGKTKEEIEIWRKVLEDVATIAGEHSQNWENDALMIEKIATDVSNMLYRYTLSRDFSGLVGMEAHQEKMEPLMRLDLEDEVRMVGIWGPPGIGKTTIARYIYNQISGSFQLRVFIDNVKGLMYGMPVCSDDYGAKKHIQNQFMSQLIKQKDINVPHLGAVQDRLKEMKVLIVLDNIDQLIQLDAIAKETWWFGLGSRIIITTQNQRILKAHGINHMYKVGFPSEYEACQIFCVHAFGQKFPKEGFEELAWQVANLIGQLPLGLRVMGSHFRGMSQQEWADALPRLRTRLDGNIERVLKFSYDALEDEEKDLFLYIACLFEFRVDEVKEILADSFTNVTDSLRVLTEKSLIHGDSDIWMPMHELLVKLGREIIRHELGQKSVRKPGKRRFLVDAKDICEVLTDDTKASRNVIGINLDLPLTDDEFNIRERALERMSNLEFVRLRRPFPYDDYIRKSYSPSGLYDGKYLPPKLRMLEWEYFPMTCLPSNFRTEHLVQLKLRYSKLEKLWDGIQPLGNLWSMDLSFSKDLEELPDLSTATNIQQLYLVGCISLVELHLSAENVANLLSVDISRCSSIVNLSFMGNATNLRDFTLDGCTSLVELSSTGTLHRLEWLALRGCSKIETLLPNISLGSLEMLDCNDCVSLKNLPEIPKNIKKIYLRGTALQDVLLSTKSWCPLDQMEISYFENLQDFPHALKIVTVLCLNDTEIQEIPSCVKRMSRLQEIILNGCKNLVSLPQLSDSLSRLDAENCESLERLDCSFQNPKIELNFVNCLKLNKEARELIIRTTCSRAVLPGGEVPAQFTYRATSGSSMRVSLNQRPLSTTSRLKACVSLVNKGVAEAGDDIIAYAIKFVRNGLTFFRGGGRHFNLPALVTEHLYMVEVETEETFIEVSFDFKVRSHKWGIGEGGTSVSLIKTNSETQV